MVAQLYPNIGLVCHPPSSPHPEVPPVRNVIIDKLPGAVQWLDGDRELLFCM